MSRRSNRDGQSGQKELVREMNHLRVSGQSMTPRLDSGVCSSASMIRDNEDDEEEEMEIGSQMQTVVDMNNALEKRVEALRLRIQIQEKHHEAEREQMHGDKKKNLREKNTEIETLHGKLNDKDAELSYESEQNRTLKHTIEEKDAQILDLKAMTVHVEEYSRRLERQMMRRKHTAELTKQQRNELGQLREEVHTLKSTMTSLQLELIKAKCIIDAQSTELRLIESQSGQLPEVLKEGLEKSSRQMCKEVERVRAVMTQQWEDMRAIRVMNQKYCSDIKTLQRSNDVLQSQNTQIRGDLKDVKQGIAMLSKQLTERKRVPTVARAEHLPDIKNETTGWELGWQSDEKAIGKPKATSNMRYRAKVQGQNKYN